jgi:hypothetical protein
VKLRLRAALLLIAVAAFTLWRSQLFLVTRPGDQPRPLRVIAAASRKPARFDVILPVVPVGAAHLAPGGAVLIVHYWAPWQRHAASQAAALDSLSHLDALTAPPNGAALRVAVVCFDPFPSLARYVARQRLRLPVLLDARRALAGTLPCPSVPFTYVIDAAGRIAVAQAGEEDWLGAETRASIIAIGTESSLRSGPDSSVVLAPGSATDRPARTHGSRIARMTRPSG